MSSQEQSNDVNENSKKEVVYRPTVSPDFDFEGVVHRPLRKLIFATTPRCGSHYICSHFFQTYRAGLPLEYFNPAHWSRWQDRADTRDHWLALSYLVDKRMGRNGVFSVKMHWPHMAALPNKKFREWFDQSLWIQIQRADVIAQAVSWEIAVQSGSWIYTQPQWKSPKYSFEKIFGKLVRIFEQRAQWKDFFKTNGIDPYVIVYEHFMQNPVGEAQAVLDELKIPQAYGSRKPEIPAIDIQRREINSEWYSTFVRDLISFQSRLEAFGESCERWSEKSE